MEGAELLHVLIGECWCPHHCCGAEGKICIASAPMALRAVEDFRKATRTRNVGADMHAQKCRNQSCRSSVYLHAGRRWQVDGAGSRFMIRVRTRRPSGVARMFPDVPDTGLPLSGLNVIDCTIWQQGTVFDRDAR